MTDIKEVKKITLDLTRQDGNAYALMGAFKTQARREGWTNAEIVEVLNEMQDGDYNHLIQTLLNHTN